MTEKIKKTTPVGIAKWAYIHKPKQPFHEGAEPKYCIDVYFPKDDPAWATWLSELKADMQTAKTKKSPVKMETDDNDNPTGMLCISFKTSDKFQPAVFDRSGQRLRDIRIGNGSKVRISYLQNVYTGFGGGINFYLNAVQIIELVNLPEYSASSYGFDVEDAPFENTELEPF